MSEEAPVVDVEANEGGAIIPAAMERVNQDVALTAPVAQQESTRSYFLAQTLESTKTVPIVSANLPLDTSMVDVVEDIVEPTEGEGDSGEATEEGGDDSDESDLASEEADLEDDIVFAEDIEVAENRVVSPASTVIGSFTYLGMTFAIEAGGESVALVAVDQSKLPHAYLDAGIIVVPDTVTADGIDYYSVTRIADDAFASINSNDEAQPTVAEQATESEQSDEDGTPADSARTITTVVVPTSVTSIDDAAFADTEGLQYVVVEDGNPNYASYDGALYSADLTNLRSIPGGRVGAVRVAPSATDVAPEAFSHCASITTLVADPASAIWQKLQESDLRNASGEPIELIDADEAVVRSIAEPYTVDRETISAFRENALNEIGFFNSWDAKGATGLADLEPITRSSLRADSHTHSPSYVLLETTHLSNTEFQICGYNNANEFKRYIYGVISNGDMYKYAFLDDKGVSRTVISVTVQANGFKPYMLNDKLIVGDKATANYDADSCLNRFKNGSTATSGLYCSKCDTTINPTMVRSIGGSSPYNFKFYPECLSRYDSVAITNYVTGTGTAWTSYKADYNYAQGYVDANGGRFSDGSCFRTLYASAQNGNWRTKNSLSFPSPIDIKRIGYTCSHIYTIHGGEEHSLSSDYSVKSAGAYHYYADWDAHTYTIKYSGNGNTGGTTPADSSCVYDQDVVLRANTYTRTGYTPTGYWNTNQYGTGTKYEAGKSATAPNLTAEQGGQVILYAEWSAKQALLKFDWNADGDSVSGVLPPSSGANQLKATYDKTLPYYYFGNLSNAAVTEPKRAGYTFSGFFDAKSSGTQYYTYGITGRGDLTYIATDAVWKKNTTDTQTFYAQWQGDPITIYWDPNGGSWGNSTWTGGSQTYGDYLSLEEGPSRTGYTFAGWYTDPTNGSKISSSTKVPLRATTYYAHWTKTSVHTVTLNKNSTEATDGAKTAVYYWPDKGYQKTNGTIDETVISAPNNLIAKTDLPSRPGYDFMGFYSATSNGTQYVDANGNLKSNAPKLADKATWYAHWAKKSDYTVKLDKNATDATAGTVTAVYYWPDKGYQKTNVSTNLTIIEAPSNLIASSGLPTRNGYDFQGYYTEKTDGLQCTDNNGNLTKDAPTLEGGTTWYAHWSNAKYSITWNMKGHGLDQKPTTTEYIFGGSFALPKLSDDGGWAFGGWFTDDGCTTPAKDIDKDTYGNKTFYAKWSEKTYKIDYDMKGHGTKPTSPAEYTYTNAVSLPTPEKVEGWTFNGWYTDYNCTKPAEITSSTIGDQLFYADWSLNSHTVTWNYDGAVDADGNPMKREPETIDFNATITLGSPGSKAGYNFTGWEMAFGDKTATYDKDEQLSMPDSNVTFTATWTPKDYTTVTLSDPYLAEVTAQGPVYHWPDLGYFADLDSRSIVGYGKHIKDVPNLKSLGYQFLGWFDDVNENKSATKMIDENGNLNTNYAPAKPAEGEAIIWYAHWERISCPVDLVASYEPNSEEDAFEIENPGTYLNKIQYAYFGKRFDESSVENGRLSDSELPKRTGYTFLGYYTQKNDEVSVAQTKDPDFKLNGDQWINAKGELSSEIWNERPGKMEDFVLYAAWRLDECEVIFDAIGNVNGVEQNKEQVVLVNAPSNTKWSYGKALKAMPKSTDDTFYRNGYTFEGWYYLIDESGDDIESNRRFVSDSEGNPKLTDAQGNPKANAWDAVKTSVTLYPYWTAKTYTLVFDDNLPKIAGLEDQSTASVEKKRTVKYDAVLDLSDLKPKFDPYVFTGWYTATDQLFEGTHMTDNGDGTKRFTPRGRYVEQSDPSEIELHGTWKEPGESNYTLFWKIPGESEIKESPHTYYFTDTVQFNGTEAPVAPMNSGWRFEGWVEVDSYEIAHSLLETDEPYMEGDTIDGFKPISNWDRFFVAKWNKRAFSVSFSTAYTEATEDGTSWLMPTDLLDDWKDAEGNKGANLSWSDACELANQKDSDMSTGITYDNAMPSFVLPDVKRKGQVFEGWKLLDENGNPTGELARGILIEPSKQDAQGMRDLVYAPVFKDAIYTIVLEANVFGEEQRYEGDRAVPYSGEFTFPYPATLSTGSVFECWAADTNTVSSGTYKAYPGDTVKLAPTYDEMGQMTKFGLALLADDNNVITLHAVWNNANYHVDVPLFANLAIDTERGDVIAGVNTLQPDSENKEADAIYQVESIRYQPLTDAQGNVAFKDAKDGVYLSVYAGLSLGENSDEGHLLYANNVDEKTAELTYTDAENNERTATPLLIQLGGESTVLYTRTAPTGSTSLEAVTDEDAPNGFLAFSAKNPLTVRYGLFFENPQTRKDFAFGSDKYQWLLPRNDGANKSTEPVDTESEDYGRGNAWSGQTADIAKLHYTLSIVNETK